MKNLYNLSPKAYKEGYGILNLLSNELKAKIPNNIWNFIKENMDKNYNISYKDIESNNIQYETSLLLAILYKEYIASDEEKKIINAKERIIKNKKREKSYTQYNCDDLFKNKRY